MKPPRQYSTEAVVIRHRDLGEADRVITLYTPYAGKIQAIARGVRNRASRRAAHLELFVRSTVMLASGRDSEIVVQAEEIERISSIAGDLDLYGRAHYISELLDAFTANGVPNPELYRLYLETLRGLQESSRSTWLRAFEMNLLDEGGYRPELHQCINCGEPIAPGHNSFSVANGGILCANCAASDSTARAISDDALKVMRNLQTQPARILGLQSMDSRVTDELERHLTEYISYRLERRPKSLAVLAAFRSTLPRETSQNDGRSDRIS